jgi:hypothetical protein
MKFAFYGPDDAAGVRRCRIPKRIGGGDRKAPPVSTGL